MKRLAGLLWLLPLSAAAQPNEQANSAPTLPLIRLNDGGSDCSHYPGSLFKPNVSGTVQLRYTVGSDGSVTGVTVTSSSGDVQLDRGATDCAKSWKFVPPRELGLGDNVSAVAIATYAANDHANFNAPGRRRDGTVNWRVPMVRSAASVALADIHGQAVKCLRERQDLASAASTALPTQLQVILSRGEISRVLVTASSGNDALDKAAIACYSAVPKDDARKRYLSYTSDADIMLPWRTLYAQPAAP